jgi:DNA-binding NarL/FixJ family response regulator
MTTIALAEDHAPTLKRFVDYFKNLKDYEVVIEASNGHDLILKLNSLKQLPDLVLIDINMPVIDGVAVAYYLKLEHPSIKLIGLSNYTDENSIENMILSGADGFVIKAAAENVLMIAIETVRNNMIYIDSRVKFNQQHISEVLVKRKERLSNENVYNLTKRERTFMMLNATSLSYEQIAETMYVETKTINSYFDRISKKLDLHNRHSITLFSLQNGLAALARFQ